MKLIYEIKNYFRQKKDDNPISKIVNPRESSKRKMIKKINTLETKVDTLESAIKDDLFKVFMETLNKKYEYERLKNENKILRKKIRNLKDNLD